MHWKRVFHYKCCTCDIIVFGENLISHIIDEHCYSCFYKCFYCDYMGYKRNDLSQHQDAKHKGCPFYSSCPVCPNFASRDRNKIIDHIITNHYYKVNLYKCNYCSYKTPSKTCNHHIFNVHYPCALEPCKIVCTDPFELFSHYSYEHFPILALFYTCKECPAKIFRREVSLNQHITAKHNIDYDPSELHGRSITIITCNNCSCAFLNRRRYYDHMDKCFDVLYSCPFKKCLYKSERFWSLTQHFRDKHLLSKVFYYICTEDCEYESMNCDNLRDHLYFVHGIVKLCTLCDSYEEDLIDHIYYEHDHFAEYLSCLLCNEEFTDLESFDDHLFEDHDIYIPPELRSCC